MKKNSLLILIFICIGCNMIGAGTLGTFQQWVFPVTEEKMNQEIDIFYKNNPSFVVPKKWEYLDSWKERGYGFLNGKIFYFKSRPEEMFYITFNKHRDEFATEEEIPATSISIRAVNNAASYSNGTAYEKWNTADDFKNNNKEKDRINKRFYREVIVKLENQMKVKSQKYNVWYEFLENM